MIDMQSYHLVLGFIMTVSFIALLMVVWELLTRFVEGIEESAASFAGPLQGAVILALCRPRVSFVVAYRFSFATQKRYDWQGRA